jgi:hypothetical protein
MNKQAVARNISKAQKLPESGFEYVTTLIVSCSLEKREQRRILSFCESDNRNEYFQEIIQAS